MFCNQLDSFLSNQTLVQEYIFLKIMFYFNSHFVIKIKFGGLVDTIKTSKNYVKTLNLQTIISRDSDIVEGSSTTHF